MNFSDSPSSDLLRAYDAILDELTRRKIIRTRNNPAADLAEYLTWKTLGGNLSRLSKDAYDLIDGRGRRVQVKCRRVEGSSKPFGAFSSFEFDVAVFVLFEPNSWKIRRAIAISAQQADELATKKIKQARSALIGKVLKYTNPHEDLTVDMQYHLDNLN
ncbi:hypothetical protein [Psychromicrobium sp. YIM B11713]|uniref:hypothetical protein n=1 Tax=Psychromicrobium sp. YIM B11713 TaxID=3145233 RepID=UPI00374F3985